jgi:hypothetical protein
MLTPLEELLLPLLFALLPIPNERQSPPPLEEIRYNSTLGLAFDRMLVVLHIH